MTSEQLEEQLRDTMPFYRLYALRETTSGLELIEISDIAHDVVTATRGGTLTAGYAYAKLSGTPDVIRLRWARGRTYEIDQSIVLPSPDGDAYHGRLVLVTSS